MSNKRVEVDRLHQMIMVNPHCRELMREFTLFAFSIGCETTGEWIVCDPSQRIKLIEWWKDQ